MAHRLLLDTSSLMYRAFFSVPTTITDAGGRPSNAVYGYLDMTARLIGSRSPEECMHVYDHDWRPAARVASYAGYKAQRPPDPDGLPEQFDTLREVLDALGLPQAWAIDWEAEDAIGSIAEAAPAGDRIEIVTGDRDLLQLVRDPAVRVLFTLRGVTQLHEFDEAGVREKYGVPPDRYAEFATLRGDPSDGLPGVRGVGEKTARELVRAYPSIETMLTEAGSVRRGPGPLSSSASLRAKLSGSADYLASMREVVPIRRDLPVEVRRPPGDPGAFDGLVERLGVGGPARRLRAAIAGSRGRRT